MFVPVVDKNGSPLMPTTPSRARRWIKSRKATPFWKRGIFCVRLNQEGKNWFYQELKDLGRVETRSGWETKQLRDALGLEKSKKKQAEIFESHCVDSWVLANSVTGGHRWPDNRRLLCITPLRFHRRQLHRLEPDKGGIRRLYGSTRSLGLKRGSLVKHPRWGASYVGGTSNKRISLHSSKDGKRLCQNAKPTECKFLTFNSWRTRLLP